MVDLARIVGGFGLVTVLLAILKHNAERRCWRTFKRFADEWANGLLELGGRSVPKRDEEWIAVCERMLSDAKFSPLEIYRLIDTAVLVAKGIAADKFLMP